MKELIKLALMITILAIFLLSPWYAFSQNCPEGCQCISEENATKTFGKGNYLLCQKTPCGEERSASSGAIAPKYCINSICPRGCFCLNQYEAKLLELEPSSNRMVSCGVDPMGIPKYCFASAVNCPSGCLCVTEREANVFGFKEFCQNQRIECGRGDIKYCFKVPKYACPVGCTCLSEEEASDKGLTDRCLDQAKIPILCEVIDAEKGIAKFCYKQPDQKKRE